MKCQNKILNKNFSQLFTPIVSLSLSLTLYAQSPDNTLNDLTIGENDQNKNVSYTGNLTINQNLNFESENNLLNVNGKFTLGNNAHINLKSSGRNIITTGQLEILSGANNVFSAQQNGGTLSEIQIIVADILTPAIIESSDFFTTQNGILTLALNSLKSTSALNLTASNQGYNQIRFSDFLNDTDKTDLTLGNIQSGDNGIQTTNSSHNILSFDTQDFAIVSVGDIQANQNGNNFLASKLLSVNQTQIELDGNLFDAPNFRNDETSQRALMGESYRANISLGAQSIKTNGGSNYINIAGDLTSTDKIEAFNGSNYIIANTLNSTNGISSSNGGKNYITLLNGSLTGNGDKNIITTLAASGGDNTLILNRHQTTISSGISISNNGTNHIVFDGNATLLLRGANNAITDIATSEGANALLILDGNNSSTGVNATIAQTLNTPTLSVNFRGIEQKQAKLTLSNENNILHTLTFDNNSKNNILALSLGTTTLKSNISISNNQSITFDMADNTTLNFEEGLYLEKGGDGTSMGEASFNLNGVTNISGNFNNQGILNLNILNADTILKSDTLTFSSGLTSINFLNSTTSPSIFSLKDTQDNLRTLEIAGGEAQIHFKENGTLSNGIQTSNQAKTHIFVANGKTGEILGSLNTQDEGKNFISFEHGASSLTLKGEINTIETIDFINSTTSTSTPASSLILDASTNNVHTTLFHSLDNNNPNSGNLAIQLKGNTNNQADLTLLSGDNQITSLSAETDKNNFFTLMQGKTTISDAVEIASSKALTINLNNDANLSGTINNTGGEATLLFATGNPVFSGTLNLSGGTTTLQIGAESNTENVLATLTQAMIITNSPTINLLFCGGAALEDTTKHTAFLLNGNNNTFNTIISKSNNALLTLNEQATANVSDKISIVENKVLSIDFQGNGDSTITTTNGIDIAQNATLGISIGGSGSKTINGGNITLNDHSTILIDFQENSSASVSLGGNNNLTISANHQSIINFWGESTSSLTSTLTLDGGSNTVNFYKGEATLRGIILTSGSNTINVSTSAIGHINTTSVGNVTNIINLKGGTLSLDDANQMGNGTLTSSATLASELNFLQGTSTLLGGFGANGNGANAQINVSSNGIISGNVTASNDANTTLQFKTGDTTITLQGSDNTLTKVLASTQGGNFIILDGKNDNSNVLLNISQELIGGLVGLGFGSGIENKKVTLTTNSSLSGINLEGISKNNTVALNSGLSSFINLIAIQNNQGLNFDLSNGANLTFSNNIANLNGILVFDLNGTNEISGNIITQAKTTFNLTNNAITTFNNIISTQDHAQATFNLGDTSSTSTTIKFREGFNSSLNSVNIFNLKSAQTIVQSGKNGLIFNSGINFINFEQNDSILKWQILDANANAQSQNILTKSSGKTLISFGVNGKIDGGITSDNALTTLALFAQAHATISKNLVQINDGSNDIVFEGSSHLTIEEGENAIHQISVQANSNAELNTPSAIIQNILFEDTNKRLSNTSSLTLSDGDYEIKNLNSISDATLILSANTNSTIAKIHNSIQSNNLIFQLKGDVNHSSTLTLLAGNNSFQALNIATDSTNNYFIINKGKTTIATATTIANNQALSIELAKDGINFINDLYNTGGTLNLIFSQGQSHFGGALNLSGGTTTIQVGIDNNTENVLASLDQGVNNSNNSTLNLLFKGGSPLDEVSKSTSFILKANNTFNNITSQSNNAQLLIKSSSTIGNKITIEEDKALKLDFDDGDLDLSATNGIDIKNNATLGISLNGAGQKNIIGAFTPDVDAIYHLDITFQPQSSSTLDFASAFSIKSGSTSTITFNGETQIANNLIALDGGQSTINFNSGNSSLKGIVFHSGSNVINTAQSAIGHITSNEIKAIDNTINLYGGTLFLDTQDSQGGGSIISSTAINELNFLVENSVLFGGFGASGLGAEATINVNANGKIKGNIITDNQANTTLNFGANDAVITLQGNQNIISKITGNTTGNKILLDSNDEQISIQTTILEKFSHQNIILSYGEGKEQKSFILNQGGELGGIELSDISTNNTLSTLSQSTVFTQKIQIKNGQAINFELGNNTTLNFTEGLTYDQGGSAQLSLNSFSSVLAGSTIELNHLAMSNSHDSSLVLSASYTNIDTLSAQQGDTITLTKNSELQVNTSIDGEFGLIYDEGEESKKVSLYASQNNLSFIKFNNNSILNTLAIRDTQTSIAQTISLQNNQSLVFDLLGDQNILNANFSLNNGEVTFHFGNRNTENSLLILNGNINNQSIQASRVFFNLESQNNILENGNQGLELSGVQSVFNFLTPNATLAWKNQSGEITNITTSGQGQTEFYLDQGTQIQSGVLSNQAVSIFNIKSGSNFILGNLLVENNGENHINFISNNYDSTLSLGDINMISSIAVDQSSNAINTLDLTSSTSTDINQAIVLEENQNLTIKLGNTALFLKQGISLGSENKGIGIIEVGTQGVSSHAKISGETINLNTLQFAGENTQLDLCNISSNNQTTAEIHQMFTQASNAILKLDTALTRIASSFKNIGIILGGTQASKLVLNGDTNLITSLTLEGEKLQHLHLLQGLTVIDQTINLNTNQTLKVSLDNQVQLSLNNPFLNDGGNIDFSFIGDNSILNGEIQTISGTTTLNLAQSNHTTISKSITTSESATTQLFLSDQASITLEGEKNNISILNIESHATLNGNELKISEISSNPTLESNLIIKNSLTQIETFHNTDKDRLIIDASNNATKVNLSQLDAPINIALSGISEKNFTNLSLSGNMTISSLLVNGSYNILDLTKVSQVQISQPIDFQNTGAVMLELHNTQINAPQGLKNDNGAISFRINSNQTPSSVIFMGTELAINHLIFEGENNSNFILKNSNTLIQTIATDNLGLKSIILDSSASPTGISLDVAQNFYGKNIEIQLYGELNKPAILTLEGKQNELQGITIAQNSVNSIVEFKNGKTLIESALSVNPNQSLNLNIDQAQLVLSKGLQTQNNATSTLNFTNTNNTIFLLGENNQVTHINGNGHLSLSENLTYSPKTIRSKKELQITGQIKGDLDFTLLIDSQRQSGDHISIEKTQNTKQHHTLHLAFANANPSDITDQNKIALATYNDSNDHVSFEIGNTTLGFETISVQTQTQETDINANPQGVGYQTIFLNGIQRLGIVDVEQKITASAFAFNYDLFIANFNSLNKRMGELRANSNSQGIWTRIFNGSQIDEFGLGSKSNYTTIQMGYDYNFGGEGYNNYLGFALSYALAISTSNQAFDSSGAQRKLENIYSNAIEGAFYNSYVSDSGWYNDTIIKASYLMSSFEINNINKQISNKNQLANYAVNISNEIGYRVGFGNDNTWFFDPQLETSFGYFSQGDFKQILEDVFYLDAKAESMIVLRGRAGLSLGYDFKNFASTDGSSGNLYAGAFYEFDYVHGGQILMTTQSGVTNNQYNNIQSDGRVVVNIGTNIKIQDHTRLYIDFEKSFLGKIHTEYQVNFGLRYGFGEKNEYRVKTSIEKYENTELENKVNQSGFYIELLNTTQPLTKSQKAILSGFDYKTQRNEDGSLSFLIGPYPTQEELISKLRFFSPIANKLGGKIKGIRLNIQTEE